MRHRMRWALCALCLVAAAAARADGHFVWRWDADRDLSEPTQKALVGYKDGQETLVLQVRYAGAASDFGWLVPLPAKPEVSVLAEAEDPFAQLSYYMQSARAEAGLAPGGTRRARPMADDDAVQVLERGQAGAFDLAVLSAGSGGALQAWLGDNGFKVRADEQQLLDDYTRQGWVFAAFKIRPQALSSTAAPDLGDLPAVALRFKAPRAVLPLRVSSLNPGLTELLLYTLGEGGLKPVPQGHLPRFGDQPAPLLKGAMPQFAPVERLELPKAFDALRAGAWRNARLAKYRVLVFPDEMDQDLYLDPAGVDDGAEPRGLTPPTAALLDRPRPLPGAALDLPGLLQRARQVPLQPAWLAAMAQGPDPLVRAAAASHPAIADAQLKALVGDPDAGVRRAVAARLGLPAPWRAQLASDRDAGVRATVAQLVDLPAELAQVLAADVDRGVRQNLARNPACDAAVLAALAAQGLPEALDNPACPESAREAALRLDDPQQRAAAVRSLAHLDHAQIRRLLTDTNDGVRLALATRPDLPEDDLLALAGDPIAAVRGAVVQALRGSSDALKQFLKDPDAQVRAMLGGRPGLPEDLYRQLALDPEPQVRQAAGYNVSVSSSSMVLLLRDPAPEVRRRIAERRDLPDELFGVLAQDADPVVRLAVAGNWSAPTASIEALSKDPDPGVQGVAARALDQMGVQRAHKLHRAKRAFDLEPGSADESDPAVRSAQAWSRQTPGAILARLAKDNDAGVRRAVAGNPGCPLESLVALGLDPDASVRASVAANAGCPMALLVRLSADRDPQVRRSAAGSGRLPLENWLNFLEHEPEAQGRRPPNGRSIPAPVLELLARDPDEGIRRQVAGLDGLPNDAQALLLRDASAAVRLQALSRYGAWDDWQAAARDSDFNLAQTARERLRQGEDLHRALAGADWQVRRASQDAEALAASPDGIRQAVARRAGVSTTPEVWAVLEGSPDPRDRAALLANPALPAASFHRLAASPNLDPDMAAQVLLDPRASVDEIRAAVGRLDPSRCAALAADPATSPAVLQGLFLGALVQDALRRRPDFPRMLDALASSGDAYQRGRVATVATVQALLLRLAQDADPTVRWAVAGNPADGLAVLERLLGDADATTRRLAAGHSSLGRARLRKLSRDPDPAVAAAAQATLEALPRRVGPKKP
jgi:hypothetical protein